MVGATSVPPMLPSMTCQFWLSNQAALLAVSDPRAPLMLSSGATRQMLTGMGACPFASVISPPASTRDTTCASATCGISTAAEIAKSLARDTVMRPRSVGDLLVLILPAAWKPTAEDSAPDSGAQS